MGKGILISPFELPCASVSKRVVAQNLSYENEFDLHENEPVGETHFYMNDFALRLILTQRQKATRKCILSCIFSNSSFMKTRNTGESDLVGDNNCLCFFRSKLFYLLLVKSKCLRLWSNRSLMRVGLRSH